MTPIEAAKLAQRMLSKWGRDDELAPWTRALLTLDRQAVINAVQTHDAPESVDEFLGWFKQKEVAPEPAVKQKEVSAPAGMRDTRWAAAILERHAAGEVFSITALDIARKAMRHENYD